MSSSDLCSASASDLARSIRTREVSAEEVMRAQAGADRPRQPYGERHRHAAARAAARTGPRSRSDPRARRCGRPPVWAADSPQGSGRDEGRSDHQGLAALSGLGAGARRPDRRTAQAGRRHLSRQDQHSGVRRRLSDLQRGVRRHPQPLRPQQDLRRQQRRCGGGAGLRHGWPSPMAATPAAACGIRSASATSSASARRRPGSRPGLGRWAGLPFRCRGPWPTASPTRL